MSTQKRKTTERDRTGREIERFNLVEVRDEPGDEVLAAYHPKVTTASEGVAVVGEVTVLAGDVDGTQGVVA